MNSSYEDQELRDKSDISLSQQINRELDNELACS